VEEYGRELRKPPELVFDNLVVIGLEDATPRAWSVLVDFMYTVEEGRSDLPLELVLTETVGEQYNIQIYDLHVL
jgi:hypothetical protein